jgi:hypothetical protein
MLPLFVMFEVFAASVYSLSGNLLLIAIVGLCGSRAPPRSRGRSRSSYDGKCLFKTNPRIGDHRRSALWGRFSQKQCHLTRLENRLLGRTFSIAHLRRFSGNRARRMQRYRYSRTRFRLRKSLAA